MEKGLTPLESYLKRVVLDKTYLLQTQEGVLIKRGIKLNGSPIRVTNVLSPEQVFCS